MTMDTHLYAVIMAGGKGERFWPLSTSRRPKQVLSLVGGKPLIQMAVERLDGLIPPERVFVVTSADMAEPIRRHAPALPPANVIGEPAPRDTAAACALGMAAVGAHDPEGVMCVLTADHVIGNHAVFHATLRDAAQVARTQHALVTIGIPPAEPSTGFGYIEGGDPVPYTGATEFVKARRFVEKPDAATAQAYVASGNFYWNSGMFVWTVDAFRHALRRHRPRLLDMVEQVVPHIGRADCAAVLERAYADLEKISIDYAVMEKAGNIIMARGAFSWNDVGSWPALENHFPRNADGNVVLGQGEAVDAEHNIVVSHERLTALVGVRDLVVVQAPGATLICHKERAQDVKAMVRKLAQHGAYDELL
jgi:mannose-1-phosphate guanylyltransferase